MKLTSTTKIILQSFLILTLFGFSVRALAVWTAPSSTPPAGNVAPPVNSGGATQQKSGGLVVGFFRSLGITILDDDVTISSGNPAAGKVLTAVDSTGLTEWADMDALPSGTSGQTLRHDGTAWVANSVLANDGSKVSVTGNFEMPDTASSTVGVLIKNGSRFLHNYTNYVSGQHTNIFLGQDAGNFTTSGLGQNNGIGYESLKNITSGYYNNALGAFSLGSNTTGGNNVAIGNSALAGNTTGSGNVAIGSSAGQYLLNGSTSRQTGTDGIYLGHSTRASADGLTKEIVIGNSAVGAGSNSVTIGTASNTKNIFYGALMPNNLAGTAGQVLTSAGPNAHPTWEDASGGVSSSGTVNYIPRFSPDGNSLANSSMFQNPANGDIGINTTIPAAKLAISGNLNVGTNYAGVAGQANGLIVEGNVGIGTSSPLQQLQITGAFRIPNTTSSTTGVIYKDANRFLHNRGTENTFLGVDSGNFTTSGTGRNTGVGAYALSGVTTGLQNTAIGAQSYRYPTTGSYNTAVGAFALINNSGSSNTAIGNAAISTSGSGQYNTAVGSSAGAGITSGGHNVAMGYHALASNNTGSYNVALGIYSLHSNTSGSDNIAIGADSGRYLQNSSGNITGSSSIFIGKNSRAFTAGNINQIVIGHDAVGAGSNSVTIGNTSNTKNVFYGALMPNNLAGTAGQVLTSAGPNAHPTWTTINVLPTGTSGQTLRHDGTNWVANSTLYNNGTNIGIGTTTPNQQLEITGAFRMPTTISQNVGVIYKGTNRFLHDYGANNTFLGVNSGNFTMTGSANTTIGYQALSLNTSGHSNTALGAYALQNNTGGLQSTAVGHSALYSSQGTGNTGVGYEALKSNSGGSNATYNTAVGYQALSNNSNGGHYNTAIGYQALNTNTGGAYNVAVGRLALSNVISVGYNVGIGDNAGPSDNFFNTISIGWDAEALGNNYIRIGNSDIQDAYVQVPWTYGSDRRFKKDIKDLDLGLEFINRLRPVSYKLTNQEDEKESFGFIAQEVEEVLNGRQAELINTQTTEEAYKYMRYDDLIAPMINAIQELKAENDSLKARIEALEAKIK